MKTKQKTEMPTRGAGFTLLELIAVMGIIVVMSVVVVGSYTSIMRTIASTSGINALRKAAMLCRQHACLDGKRTYFWVTGPSTYVLSRKAGKITIRRTGNLQKEDYEKSYMPEGPKKEGGGMDNEVLWIEDTFSDLGGAEQSFGGTFANVAAGDEQDNLGNVLAKGDYASALVFDIGDEGGRNGGAMALLKYPPWYIAGYGKSMMGLCGLEDPNDANETLSIPETAFKAGHTYGWALYPEQELPKGYVFDDAVLDEDGAFIEGPSFYFDPEGTSGSDGVERTTTITLHEVGTGKKPSLIIEKTGDVTSRFQ